MASGLPNPPCCPAATRTGATGARPPYDSNKPPRRIWKPCSKPAVLSRLLSATNLFSPPDLWANIPPGTAASWSAVCVRLGVNFFAPRAATGTTQIPSVLTASSRLRGIPATCLAASSPTLSKTLESVATIFTSGNSDFRPFSQPSTLNFQPILNHGWTQMDTDGLTAKAQKVGRAVPCAPLP